MKRSSISIILAEPENVDNIGAVARAMRNMSLSNLKLVLPPKSWKSKGKKMAMKGYSVLDKAKVYKNLKSAIKDQKIVIGLSRRHGNYRRDYVPLHKTVELTRSKKSKIAFVFGKESKGLSNEDLSLCDWMTTIPSNPQCASLNLAQAVMVVAFSLYTPDQKSIPSLTEDAKYLVKNTEEAPFLRVTKAETEDVLMRFREALLHLGYKNEGDAVVDRIEGTLYRLFSRASLLRSEAKMFKGLARRILKHPVKKSG